MAKQFELNTDLRQNFLNLSSLLECLDEVNLVSCEAVVAQRLKLIC